MEPQFTKDISNRNVCNYLYFYFYLVLVVSIIGILSAIGMALSTKGSLLIRFLMVLPSLIGSALGTLLALSLYIICERGLMDAPATPKTGDYRQGAIADGFNSR